MIVALKVPSGIQIDLFKNYLYSMGPFKKREFKELKTLKILKILHKNVQWMRFPNRLA